MAIAEWEYLCQNVCSLGEVIGYQYRLAFTSVYADSLNYLPKSRQGVFDRRICVRVPLPDDVPTRFGETVVEAKTGPEVLGLTRHHVRHEVWGGARYLNLQAEMPQKTIRKGTTVRYTLPVR